MFLLDSLMISGIRWTLETVVAAAEAELNDDGALREQLLDAAQRRDVGEITEARYLEIEADLLSRIREIKQRRDGGHGPLAFGASSGAVERDDTRIAVEATLAGDFHAHAPAEAPPSATPPSATPPSATLPSATPHSTVLPSTALPSAPPSAVPSGDRTIVRRVARRRTGPAAARKRRPVRTRS